MAYQGQNIDSSQMATACTKVKAKTIDMSGPTHPLNQCKAGEGGKQEEGRACWTYYGMCISAVEMEVAASNTEISNSGMDFSLTTKIVAVGLISGFLGWFSASYS